ncbi:MAG TPA: hypothetical protein VFQ67_04135 [Allosphingosinicella sp.]|jgi:hypothetical protein|nr:hypothetical protein [Allosphingosinicella sp.]
MIALVLAALAAPAAPAPRLVHCHMMECAWSKPVANVAVRTTPAGTLRRVSAIRGTSVHRDDPPSGYRPSIRIAWEKAASVDYVLCSRSQPAFAFRSGRRWVAHAMDLFNLGGYNTASAIAYLRACHGVEYDRADIDEVMRGLGYRPGTRSEQVEIARPEQLFDLPRRRTE